MASPWLVQPWWMRRTAVDAASRGGCGEPRWMLRAAVDAASRGGGNRICSASEWERVALAKGLADPAWVPIVRFFLASEWCFWGDLVERPSLRPSMVSHPLRVLGEARRIRGSVAGSRIENGVGPAVLERFERRVLGLWAGFSATLDR
jgi:hypothetical protein